MELTLCAPCLFGLEGPLGNELRHMGLKNVRGENGRVLFTGTESDLAGANIRSRFAERVLIELGRFPARTFDELFEGTRSLPWERFIPKNGAFPVKGYSLDSALRSVPDCQKIVKKAVSVRLGERYKQKWLPEDGPLCQVQFALMKDEASLYLDTTGVGLHKRGYRPEQVQAPLRETLAAAIVDLSGYRGKGVFCDPFCGGGTVAIEAALAAKNRAPGLLRSFSAEKWPCFDGKLWQNAREEARSREFDRDYRIFASDIDEKAVQIARQNARRAGVEELIRFGTADARAFDTRTFSGEEDGGIIVTNPPYGERMLERRDAEALMRDFFRAVRKRSGWRVNVLTSDEELERTVGERASRTRKLYNGTIKCGFFMFGEEKRRV